MLLYFYVKQIPTFWTWLIIPKVKLMYFIQPREEGVYTAITLAALSFYVHLSIIYYACRMLCLHSFSDSFTTMGQYFKWHQFLIWESFKNMLYWNDEYSENLIISITKHLEINQLNQNIFRKYIVNFWRYPWKYNEQLISSRASSNKSYLR